MNQSLLVIDYIESCCLEEFRDPQLKMELSKVRSMAKSLEQLITHYRMKKLGNVVWITCCSWMKGYVHPNVERLYEENPESEFYSIRSGGNGFYFVRPLPDEPIFEKNIYSAFTGTNGQLDSYLRNQKIEQLVISGIYSTGCVNATICEAFHLGYKLMIIEDCVETFDSEDKQIYQHNLLTDWSYMYGKVVKLSAFMRGVRHFRRYASKMAPQKSVMCQ